MADYPKDQLEFERWFSSEEACREYLIRVRWPKGIKCLRCGGEKLWLTKRKLYHCAGCGYESSVTAGTLFQDTRKPLQMWFRAMWYITNQKHGVSALGLQRVLGLGSYETAWTMLHRLRRAMVRPGRELLHGEVEVDETFLALTDRKTPVSAVGRKSKTTKALVVIAVEILQPKGFGRIRIQQIANGDYEHLLPFIKESVRAGAIIHSDGSAAYRKLAPRHPEWNPVSC